MEFKYKAETIKYDFESISPEIDAAFHKFYTAALEDNLDISAIDEKHLPDLEKLGNAYLKVNPDTETTRKYFKNLRFIWVLLYKEDKLQDAERYLARVLQSIITDIEEQGIKIHKGPMYYFWGGTALLQARLDRGFFLMHSAYDEDKRIGEPQPTPAYKFVSLKFTDKEQYFGFLVRMFADYLSKFINRYAWITKSNYDRNEFQVNFLDLNPNPDIVFSFTYTLARLHQLSLYSSHYFNNEFASQYKLNLLFDLTLVVENALRIKHPDFGRAKLLFPILADHLCSVLTWNLKEGHLSGYIQPAAEKNYDKCLTDLLDQIFPFTHQVSNRELEYDIALTYLIRNRGAHDLSSSKVINSRFDELLQGIFNVLFLVAHTLYK